MEKNLCEKIVYIVTVAFLLFWVVFGGVQTCRLHSSMEQCEHYRTELAAASNRQSEIREVVGRTGEVLRSTANTVAEIRVQLQEVENSYNYLWELVCRDNSNISDTEVKE